MKEYTNEQWKEVVGFDNYVVSNYGRVTHLKKGMTDSDYTNGKVFLNPREDRYGYYQVNLYANGKPHSKTVHRLALIAFIPNPDNKLECNHKDGNKLNNDVLNLEWNTREENMQHAYKTGLKVPTYKPVKMLSKLRSVIYTFNSMKDAEAISGIAKESIGRVCNGKQHTAGGYLWELA